MHNIYYLGLSGEHRCPLGYLFFMCAVVIFRIYVYKENYLDLVDISIRYCCDQNFNTESEWRLVRAKYAPLPLFWQLFQISLAVLRI